MSQLVNSDKHGSVRSLAENGTRLAADSMVVPSRFCSMEKAAEEAQAFSDSIASPEAGSISQDSLLSKVCQPFALLNPAGTLSERTIVDQQTDCRVCAAGEAHPDIRLHSSHAILPGMRQGVPQGRISDRKGACGPGPQEGGSAAAAGAVV